MDDSDTENFNTDMKSNVVKSFLDLERKKDQFNFKSNNKEYLTNSSFRCL